jgi:hypothetical protein
MNAFLIGVGIAVALSTQALAFPCTWDEVQARYLELNAATPLQTQNFAYINEYQGLVVTQGSLIQAALMRQDLPKACSILAHLEGALTNVNGKYR